MGILELALSNPCTRMKFNECACCCFAVRAGSNIASHVEELEQCKGRRRRPLQAARSAAPRREAPPSGAKRRPSRPVPAARPKFGPRRHLQSQIARHLVGCSPTLENWMLTGFVGLQVCVFWVPHGCKRCSKEASGPSFRTAKVDKTCPRPRM